jgi:hypothetical protein
MPDPPIIPSTASAIITPTDFDRRKTDDRDYIAKPVSTNILLPQAGFARKG